MQRKSTRAKKPLVLVVDDFEDGRVLAMEILKRNGFRVIAAGTGESALDMAAQMKPDAVLMDLGLPGLDGWEAIRLLKKDPATRACAVVAYTAHAVRELLDRARDAGCEGVLTKPCRSAELVAELERVLRERSSEVAGHS